MNGKLFLGYAGFHMFAELMSAQRNLLGRESEWANECIKLNTLVWLVS